MWQAIVNWVIAAIRTRRIAARSGAEAPAPELDVRSYPSRWANFR